MPSEDFDLKAINATLDAHAEKLGELEEIVRPLESTPANFFDRLHLHMVKEEEREQADAEKFERGEARMERIEEDLRPLNKMYWAVMGSTVVGTALIGLLIFIYQNDRSDVKAMQDAIYKQGTNIEKLIQSHQELEKDMRREFTRIDKEIDRNHGHR